MNHAAKGVWLSNQEQLELAAVKAGLKAVQRLERTALVATELEKSLVNQGLAFSAGNVQVVEHSAHPLGDLFMRLIPGKAQGTQQGIYYVSRPEQAEFARELARLELSDPGSPEIGRRLGYPACCVVAYADIQSGRDWLEAMLERTSAGEAGFVACNKLARLFGDWNLLPDYFPCSFACSDSAEWSAEIVESVSDIELLEYVAAAKNALELPIRIEEDTITQLDVSPRTVFHESKITKPRTLTWLSYS